VSPGRERRTASPRRRTRSGSGSGRDLNPPREHRRGRVDRLRAPRKKGRPGRPLGQALSGLRSQGRRLARAGILAAELVSLLALVNHPAFASGEIQVNGLKHLTRQHVLDRAGLSVGTSIFTISSSTAEAELMGDPYIRSVAVRTRLPNQVSVEVTEWEAIALLTRGPDHYLLNPQGNVMGPTLDTAPGREPGQPRIPIVQEGAGSLKAGQNAINSRLLTDIDNMQKSFPAAYGLTVSRFLVQPGGQLVVETTPGPRILFGQMVTDEQIDSLDAKLASLKSLSGKVDLAHSRLDYVNMENASAPATRSIPSPSPSPAPSPTKKP
jgi:hypothetical protein